MTNTNKIVIIGGGLAGCEAAYQISKFGINIDLYEMRPKVKTEAHQTKYCPRRVVSCIHKDCNAKIRFNLLDVFIIDTLSK